MADPSPHSGLKTEPYWWEAAPRTALPAVDLPGKVDVAVVGSGYTGLNAALALARAGREVLVLEAETAGWGASSRNQGQVGLMTKSSLAAMEQRHGREHAVALVREGMAAVGFVTGLIEREGIACHLRKTGRFCAAGRQASYEALARDGEDLRRATGFESAMIGRDEMLRTELACPAYVGGQVRPGEASLHGALYHAGLLARTLAAGVAVADRSRVASIERGRDGFTVHTARGTVAARDVVVATGALTGPLLPWLARRVIPISAGGIVTEPLSMERLRAVIPGLRPCIDTWRVGNTIRPSPDQTRIIFGGRRTMAERDAARAARGLQAQMIRLYPQLGDVAITHGWLGKVGYSFATLPHIGCHDGLHYATGFCGTGVAMASWLGHKIARRLLGASDAATAYDDLPFDSRPLYRGTPWFVPLTLAWYRTLDGLGR